MAAIRESRNKYEAETCREDGLAAKHGRAGGVGSARVVKLAVCGGYTRTARSARSGSSRNLALSRARRRRHRGKGAGHHEAEEASMGRGPQCGTSTQPSEPMAGQAHGAQSSGLSTDRYTASRCYFKQPTSS